MNNAAFKLKIVTPAKIIERDIRYVRLKDSTGFFGIMKGHTDFLTVIEPSLCYYMNSEGAEVFLALNGGVASIRRGTVIIVSRDAFESNDAEKLSLIIESDFAKRNADETAFFETLENIERSFMEKSVKLARGAP